MNPIRMALNNRPVTLVLIGFVFLAGVVAAFTMPRREDPKITLRAGLVIAHYPGATAEQVEAQVAAKVEERLFRFAEVNQQKTFSTSRNGLLIVQVELENWVGNPDQFWSKLRHDLRDLQQGRELPPGVRGLIVDADFGDTVALLISVTGPQYTHAELKRHAETIEAALRTLPATAKVKRYGDQREQIYVTTSLERLAQHGVAPPQIIQAVQQRNAIEGAGTVRTEVGAVPLSARTPVATEDELHDLIVGNSALDGHPFRLGDFTSIERRFEERQQAFRVDGQPAVMLTVEMHEGKNIVAYGKAVQATLAGVRAQLPPDLEIAMVANQPQVVGDRMRHFFVEFGTAILAVVLITLLLLPWRVAIIAAVTIPVTIAATFALLNVVGVELHQVSIAALIIVLGMVVDDAIVIADNYVELLDRGVSRREAAWRSASDLAVPLVTSTLTIVASFGPLAGLTGPVGEFIRALPITVTVALLTSFVVAMLLTPTLALLFIRTGLRPRVAMGPERSGRARLLSVRPLEAMERLYDRVIRSAMPHKRATLVLGAGVFVAGLALLAFVGDRFFPPAERDQFVVDVWLPEGASFETTDSAMHRIERLLRSTPQITQLASFVGTGAPRFYYNVSPEAPVANYGQIIVRTSSPRATSPIAARMRRHLPAAAPEAEVMVRELQQGAPFAAPIEVRISGPDRGALKAAAAEVMGILERTPGSQYVTTDWRQDSYRLDVQVDPEASGRLGFSNSDIARHLGSGLDGVRVASVWEGERELDILLRVGDERRARFDDVRNSYVTSPTTGLSVPLMQVATLQPVWGSSRIVRRNGVETITVRSFAATGWLASTVLRKARAEIERRPLPPGFRISYGGEYEDQQSTSGEMAIALGASLLLIFLILLLQFRTIRQPLVIMISIPLSLVGAILGLVVTGNPFSFTAFLGVIGLMGLVVRNAIILVDHMNEERARGVELEEAATGAGRRRLRPIFLTTMSLVAGVLPMILSGSLMWAPLASVLAVGITTSMVFTLIVVPVLYVVTEARVAPRITQQGPESARTYEPLPAHP